ncbi:MAG TPA: DMT family transporter [Spirillospora sp.]|nr:DMT family transporter [Spirillospora sp.]
MTVRTPWQTYAVLAAGLAAVSLAAVFIRLAQGEGIPSLVIAAARLTIAALILTPLTLPRYLVHLRQLTRRDLLLVSVSGLFLALHFILWITSLELTSVLISVVLVTTSPLWAALLEALFLKTRLTHLVMIALVLAIGGGIMIGVPDHEGAISFGSNPLLGSLFALGGAVAVAIYLVIGRSVRPKLPLLPYIWLVYGIAALFALLAVLLTGSQVMGYAPAGYLLLLAVALFPQLIGHSSFNYALKHLSATYVGVASQLEPVSSALLAFFVFREVPSSLQLLGSAVILVGVVLATIGQQKQPTH